METLETAVETVAPAFDRCYQALSTFYMYS